MVVLIPPRSLTLNPLRGSRFAKDAQLVSRAVVSRKFQGAQQLLLTLFHLKQALSLLSWWRAFCGAARIRT